jgi:hypothetical protein
MTRAPACVILGAVESYTFARTGSALRRHTSPIVLSWAAAFAVLIVLLLAFAERSGIDADRQLLPNSSFETGLAPWEETGDAPVVGRSIDEALAGRASARAEATAVDERYGIKVLPAVVHPDKGDRYVASAWVKAVGAAVGNRVTLRITQRGGESVRRSLLRVPRRLRPSWMHLRGSLRVVEDGVEDLHMYVYVSEARRVGETFFVDEVSLVRVARGEAGPARARAKDLR